MTASSRPHNIGNKLPASPRGFHKICEFTWESLPSSLPARRSGSSRPTERSDHVGTRKAGEETRGCTLCRAVSASCSLTAGGSEGAKIKNRLKWQNHQKCYDKMLTEKYDLTGAQNISFSLIHPNKPRTLDKIKEDSKDKIKVSIIEFCPSLNSLLYISSISESFPIK